MIMGLLSLAVPTTTFMFFGLGQHSQVRRSRMCADNRYLLRRMANGCQQLNVDLWL